MGIPNKLTDDEILQYVQSVVNEYNFIPSTYNRCGELKRPTWVTPRLKRYLASQEYRNREKADFFLYDVVNRCLDLTIEKLGKNNVQKKLDEYLKLLYIGTS